MSHPSILLRVPGDKRVFIAGMYWRHEDRAPTRKSLLAGANGEEFWVAKRRTKTRTLQSGFCRPLYKADFLGADPLSVAKKPYSGKKFSLGAAVADVLQEPWLGIFELADNLYWYIAVRDNYEILPDGDVVGDLDTIDRLRREHAAYGEPSTFRNGNLEDIAVLLKSGHGIKAQPIVDVRKNPVLPLVVGGGTLTVLAVGGGIAWHLHQEAVEKAQLAAQERRIAIERAMQAKRAASAILPWAAATSVQDFLGSCLQRAGQLPLSREGWMLKSLSCGSDGNRQSLREVWAWQPGATALRRPSGQLVKSGREVISTQTSVLLPASKDGTILAGSAAESQAYGLAQTLGLDVSLAKESTQLAAKLPGEEQPQKAVVVKPWETVTVSYKGPLSHFAPFLEIHDLLPGYRLNVASIDWGKDGIELTISGSLYEKNGAPVRLPEKIVAVQRPASLPGMVQ